MFEAFPISCSVPSMFVANKVIYADLLGGAARMCSSIKAF